MTDIITEIMVEVLTIFGIATKELRWGSFSKCSTDCLPNATELCVEKFLKRLAGRTDLEDSLKKLDRLTEEETRMAVSENLRVTYNVRDEVKVVDGKVERVEDKVEGMGGKVEEIADKVQCVDERVQVIIDGARCLSRQSSIPIYNFRRQRRKRGDEGSKSGYPTDCKYGRRNQVFVIP